MDPLPFESDEGKTGWQVEARLAKRRDAAGNEHRPTKRRKANRSVPRKLLIQQLLPGVADTIVWTSAPGMLFNVKELDKMVFVVRWVYHQARTLPQLDTDSDYTDADTEPETEAEPEAELEEGEGGQGANVPSAILGECWFSNYAICP